MDQFKGALSHRPLLGDEIRLLILPPGAFNDPICCRLKHVSLSECMPRLRSSIIRLG
ncbi:uncharacterized protein K444DRAFT_614067 [Hyaloscypha bicolor E]|uniref:Uncharacterized protein n=1 Tax=Hyaloscypha bicolor E TaxID=1095630 RepID=A0A2J6T8E1_9HELO|nr:uncharacterized protein K444DRAFT_614067 [Hyaloscypha bicolor E]PMD59282.1 hypothetical protein K444DRAFT_614067 [Hyaloscypha bicolor E]